MDQDSKYWGKNPNALMERQKELKRAERHKEWLRKNLPNTKMERENQKLLFKTYTELAVIEVRP